MASESTGAQADVGSCILPPDFILYHEIKEGLNSFEMLYFPVSYRGLHCPGQRTNVFRVRTTKLVVPGDPLCWQKGLGILLFRSSGKDFFFLH